MLHLPLLLIYGNDADLLKTRGWVLQKAGFVVEQAASADEVERKVALRPPEVLVLCHTLSSEQCARMALLAERESKAMKTLTIATERAGCAAKLAVPLLAVSPNPRDLIMTVRWLVASRRRLMDDNEPASDGAGATSGWA